MQKQKKAEEILNKYNQFHIIDFMNQLENEKKEILIDQILDIDFEEITQLYENTRIKDQSQKYEIKPIECIDKDKLSDDEKEELEKIGLNIIKQNKYAVITMAGGQGTRLGWDGPKGTFKLSNGKFIFQILAEKFKDFEKKYGTYPYWYVMTSKHNNDETVDFFKQHNYFELDKDKIKFFKQDELPLLTPEGKMIIEDDEIKTASNGNGAIYAALIKEKILEDMKLKNIEWLYISGVDNIMVNFIDPIFLGLTINNNMQIASKSVAKAYPEEKVGVFCKKNGKPGIVEYIELTEEMRNDKNENGDLIYGDANIISHLLNINVIHKITEQNLQYHKEIKKGLYKFEAFIFDGFKAMDDMLVMRVKRENEFAPIKNKEGVDSPDTALEIYEKARKECELK